MKLLLAKIFSGPRSLLRSSRLRNFFRWLHSLNAAAGDWEAPSLWGLSDVPVFPLVQRTS